MFAHILGVPVEETLAFAGPVLAVAIGALGMYARHFWNKLRRRGESNGSISQD